MISLLCSVMSTIFATACFACGIQNWKDVLRSSPGFNVDFLAVDAARRFHQRFMLAAGSTKFTLSVRRNLRADYSRSQMRNMAQERNRGFLVSVFHLTVRRAHG